MKLWLPYPNPPAVDFITPLTDLIVMSWRVYQDIHHVINECGRQELSWLGKVVKTDEGRRSIYYISAIRLLEQRSSSVHTRLDPAAIAQVAHEWIMEEGGKDNPCRFWGHTHPGSCTEPSSQDDAQMQHFIHGKFTPPFYIRGIFSKGSQHYHGEFTLYDYQRGIKIRHMPWEVEDRTRQQKWTRRIARRVRTS